MLTYDEVIEEITQLGAGYAVPTFPSRVQPSGEHPGPEKVFRIPVSLPGGSFAAVSFSFGQPSDDPVRNWQPLWRSVDGPMTREELEELGRE
jgi:hypothetical protein